MPRINWEAAYLNYYAERAGLIGHDARDVRGWLDAHPDYDGEIYANWNDGSDDFLVTDIFFPEPDDDAETVPEFASESNLTALIRKPTLVNTDEGYVWIDVPVEVVTDERGKIISERFIERNQEPETTAIEATK